MSPPDNFHNYRQKSFALLSLLYSLLSYNSAAQTTWNQITLMAVLDQIYFFTDGIE